MKRLVDCVATMAMIASCVGPSTAAPPAPHDAGARISGRDARAAIDRDVLPTLRIIVPPLKLGVIACPAMLSAATDRCSISIDGRSFEVAVALDAARAPHATLQAALVSLDAVDAIAAEAARQQGHPDTQLDCGLPRVRLLAVGDTLACTASRGTWSHTWALRVENAQGGLFLPGGFPASEDRALAPALARLQPILARPDRVVDGALVEAALRALPIADTAAAAFHCPARMNLSDGHHELCTMQALGESIRVRVDVHDAELRVVSEQIILEMDRLEAAAASNGAELARARGVPGVVVHVDCGTPRVRVVDYPARYTCDATLPSGTHRPVTVLLDGPGLLPTYYWGDPRDLRR